MSASTCLTLIRRIGHGTQSHTWSDFLSIYVPFIERHLRRGGLSESDACDVRQNVLCVLIRELPNFKHNGNPGAFRCWIKQVVRNQLRTFCRKRSHQSCCIADGAVDGVTDTENSLHQSWDQEFASYLAEKMLRQISARFDSASIVAFRRQFLEGTSPEVVARELGKSKPAVIAAKCRVLKALRTEAKALRRANVEAF